MIGQSSSAVLWRWDRGGLHPSAVAWRWVGAVRSVGFASSTTARTPRVVHAPLHRRTTERTGVGEPTLSLATVAAATSALALALALAPTSTADLHPCATDVLLVLRPGRARRSVVAQHAQPDGRHTATRRRPTVRAQKHTPPPSPVRWCPSADCRAHASTTPLLIRGGALWLCAQHRTAAPAQSRAGVPQ